MTTATLSRGRAGSAARLEQPVITVRDLTLGYGGRPVLRHVDFEVRAGEFLGIVGPNGSGKSTLIKALLGLLPPIAGSIERREGRDGRLHYGYVPQRETVDTAFPISVRQIVSMGRFGRVGLFRRLSKADWAVVDESLEQVGIAGLARRSYDELSGGQRQRTLIARALASEPDLLVLDEPTNGMDLAGEHGLLELVEDLHLRTGLTVVMVTHLLSTVANYADRIAIIANAGLEIGDRGEMLNEERLSRLYQMPVLVQCVQGRYVVSAARVGEFRS